MNTNQINLARIGVMIMISLTPVTFMVNTILLQKQQQVYAISPNTESSAQLSKNELSKIILDKYKQSF
jgi:hypothetical protein